MSKSRYIGGRNNDKRHERHGPEVTPERLLKLESFLPSEELKICLQITAHDKHLHVTETGAIFTDMSLLMSGAMFAAGKCSRQHATRAADGSTNGLSLATRVDRRVWHNSRRLAYLNMRSGIQHECAEFHITGCKQVMVFPQLHKPTASAKGSGI